MPQESVFSTLIEPKQKTYCFDAVLLQSGEMDASYIEFPYDVLQLFGKKGIIKIEAIFDNQIVYRGSLANMGTGCHILIVVKSIRKQLKKSFGDQIHICLKADIKERIVEIPEFVHQLFATYPEHEAFFQSQSYTKRKELIAWISDAKKTETREKRMGKMLAQIEQKMTTTQHKA